MPGSNAGTGRPLTFRCAHCRKVQASWRGGTRGYIDEVELTGRHRTRWTGNGHGRLLPGGLQLEYRCSYCKHVGWSKHSDLKHAKGHDKIPAELFLPPWEKQKPEATVSKP